MLKQVGPTELLIVLTIVLLLFGAGRVSRVGKELGKAIGDFRRELHESTQEDEVTPRKLEN